MNKILTYLILSLFVIGWGFFVFDWFDLIISIIPQGYRPNDFWGYVGFILILVIFSYFIQWLWSQIKHTDDE